MKNKIDKEELTFWTVQIACWSTWLYFVVRIN